MSEETGISWTNHTWNPMSGCRRISDGCKFCYAAAMPPAMRRHAQWGNAPRMFAPEKYWKDLPAWNRKALRAGTVARVFVASVADVFEGEPTPIEGRTGPRADYLPVLDRFFREAPTYKGLIFQVLTKRPWNAETYFRGRTIPDNVWIGTSVENQRAAEERIPYLLQIPAAVRFLSCEPLLGPVDLDPTWCHNCDTNEHVTFDPPSQPWCSECDSEAGSPDWLGLERGGNPRISWIICGGESGRNARPMHLAWARSLRDQCRAAGVPFFFKQVGSREKDKGGDLLDGERIQEFPGGVV